MKSENADQCHTYPSQGYSLCNFFSSDFLDLASQRNKIDVSWQPKRVT